MKELMRLLFLLFFVALCNQGVCVELSSKDQEINSQKMSKLIHLMKMSKWDELREYVNGGVDINMMDINGETVLLKAMQEQHVDAVKVLLDIGALPEISDRRASSPLCKAPRLEESIFLEFFLKNGADPNHNCGTSTLLGLAVFWANPKNIRILLKFGASPSAKSELGIDAVKWSCMMGRFKLMIYFLTHDYSGDKEELLQCIHSTYIIPKDDEYGNFVKIVELLGGDMQKVKQYVNNEDAKFEFRRRLQQE